MTNRRLTVTEQRWLDNHGERYTQSGDVRCQGVSKTRLAERRLVEGDPDLTSEDVFPELQCTRSAIPGKYACKFHGGMTPGMKNYSMADSLPNELREKFLSMMSDPQYINRVNEINLLRARVLQQLEKLSRGEGESGSWELVDDAMHALGNGDPVRAHTYLRDALENRSAEVEVWEEIQKSIILLDKLTRTQMSTAKDLKVMMTLDQVYAMIDVIVNSAIDGAQRYITDDLQSKAFLQFFLGELRRLSDSRALGNIESLGSGDK